MLKGLFGGSSSPSSSLSKSSGGAQTSTHDGAGDDAAAQRLMLDHLADASEMGDTKQADELRTMLGSMNKK